MRREPGISLPTSGVSQAERVAQSSPTAELRARSSADAGGHSLGVRQMFDRISPTYDKLNHLLSFGIDRRWRARTLAVLADTVTQSGPWIDSCAGTLDLAAAIQQRWPAQSLVAVDFARDMLIAGGAKLRPPAQTLVCDAARLPFAAESFAAMSCGFGIRNLADPRQAISEALRVLKPGGSFVVLEFFRPMRLLSRLFHAFYGQTVLPLVGRIVSGDAEAYSYLARSMRGFWSRAEFEQQLSAAGFRQVRGVDLTLGVASIVWGVK
jgi:demethylmenaquinone methyltransferase / 2-methoxy-6-polyprenyl-1,4-benzoquinol methylase